MIGDEHFKVTWPLAGRGASYSELFNHKQGLLEVDQDDARYRGPSVSRKIGGFRYRGKKDLSAEYAILLIEKIYI